MAKKAEAAAPVAGQSIEQLEKRYQSLNKARIQAETHLENAGKQLEALQREAREAYGTDDLDELRRKLAAMQAENEQKRRAYESELDRIEQELKDIEERHAATTAAAADGPEAG